MFAFKPIKEQALDLRRENVRLRSALKKNTADIDYIAMMSDIELDSGETDETEDENNEQ